MSFLPPISTPRSAFLDELSDKFCKINKPCVWNGLATFVPQVNTVSLEKFQQSFANGNNPQDLYGRGFSVISKNFTNISLEEHFKLACMWIHLTKIFEDSHHEKMELAALRVLLARNPKVLKVIEQIGDNLPSQSLKNEIISELINKSYDYPGRFQFYIFALLKEIIFVQPEKSDLGAQLAQRLIQENILESVCDIEIKDWSLKVVSLLSNSQYWCSEGFNEISYEDHFELSYYWSNLSVFFRSQEEEQLELAALRMLLAYNSEGITALIDKIGGSLPSQRLMEETLLSTKRLKKEQHNLPKASQFYIFSTLFECVFIQAENPYIGAELASLLIKQEVFAPFLNEETRQWSLKMLALFKDPDSWLSNFFQKSFRVHEKLSFLVNLELKRTSNEPLSQLDFQKFFFFSLLAPISTEKTTSPASVICALMRFQKPQLWIERLQSLLFEGVYCLKSGLSCSFPFEHKILLHNLVNKDLESLQFQQEIQIKKNFKKKDFFKNFFFSFANQILKIESGSELYSSWNQRRLASLSCCVAHLLILSSIELELNEVPFSYCSLVKSLSCVSPLLGDAIRKNFIFYGVTPNILHPEEGDFLSDHIRNRNVLGIFRKRSTGSLEHVIYDFQLWTFFQKMLDELMENLNQQILEVHQKRDSKAWSFYTNEKNKIVAFRDKLTKNPFMAFGDRYLLLNSSEKNHIFWDYPTDTPINELCLHFKLSAQLSYPGEDNSGEKHLLAFKINNKWCVSAGFLPEKTENVTQAFSIRYFRKFSSAQKARPSEVADIQFGFKKIKNSFLKISKFLPFNSSQNKGIFRNITNNIMQIEGPKSLFFWSEYISNEIKCYLNISIEPSFLYSEFCEHLNVQKAEVVGRSLEPPHRSGIPSTRNIYFINQKKSFSTSGIWVGNGNVCDFSKITNLLVVKPEGHN